MNDQERQRWLDRYGGNYDTPAEREADFERYIGVRAGLASIFAEDAPR